MWQKTETELKVIQNVNLFFLGKKQNKRECKLVLSTLLSTLLLHYNAMSQLYCYQIVNTIWLNDPICH